ncbi:bacitracin resistance BacA family protein [Mycobacteroides abscessus 21]|uniref:Undecaprenyl-diphosphatase n=1 Tax=Mycobacteroides abscessus 21 TaxID=1299324 RepID=A0A829Q6G9_9MYCO|nr:bacitracin resistance BacA family protein [Mycobacteroides abscessus 21]
MTYTQAIVIGALQGVTELFPVSSLGHSVLVPAWIGGSWQQLVTQGDSDSGTPYLAFVVGLHVATALALLVFYWRDWVGIIGGLITSVRTRKVETSTQRLGWLIVVATIPVGLLGLLLEHSLRTLFAKPGAAAVFLFLNGLLLAGAEVLRRQQVVRPATGLAPKAPSRSPTWVTRTRAPSAWRRVWRCSPASAARAWRWSVDCFVAWTTRIPRSSHSCWLPR